jgi:MOSC domain-containing protein YiiM
MGDGAQLMASSGRVVQVSVSRGGVPKLPVAQAWVGRLGLEGDAHREHTVHGGPHRAVCLFSMEAIERLQAEGHPVEPGSTGENLTTAGIEWSTLPVGTRARVGGQLLLELASSTTPCETQRPNFIGGRFSRINIALHPTDSRMYARVLEEGPVQAGDGIELLQPADDSRAQTESQLLRIDPV